jgi:hypothetical protein
MGIMILNVVPAPWVLFTTIRPLVCALRDNSELRRWLA